MKMKVGPAPPPNDLAQRVRQFFDAANLPALRRVRVEVRTDSVVLIGQVSSFYQKQMATEFARRVAGVRRVINLLEVKYDSCEHL